MMRKTISIGIVSLFVIGGLVGILSIVPVKVEAPGPTYVSGLLLTNTTWTADNSPYIIFDNVTLMTDVTLIIEAGSEVKFNNNTWLAIRGKLHVEGNNANQVVFTANGTLSNFTDERDYDKRYYYNGTGSNFQIFIDAENGGKVNISYAKFEFSSAQNGALRLGSSSEPQIIADTIFKNNRMGIWTGGYYSNCYRCIFENNYMGILNAKGTFSNCIFNNNTVGIYSSANIEAINCSFIKNICGLESGTAKLEYCIISNNNFGIYELYDSTFTRNSINNNKIGIIPRPDSFPITTNNIYDNTEYNIMLIGSSDINVTNNWWGTTNTTIIDQYIYDIYDDISLGEAIYMPILTAPSPGAPTETSGLQPGAPWPMFRGNVRHTGLSPYDTSGNPGEVKWSFRTGGMVVSSPAIGNDGTIYVGSHDNKLYAIYPDGTEKWNFTTSMNIEKSSPAISSNGTIYLGSYNTYLYAINPDGTQKWSFKTDSSVYSSPAIGFDGTIYVGSDDKKLYAINPNGTEKWNFMTGGLVRSSPAIDSDGTIYVSSKNTELYAINSNGTEKWSFDTDGSLESSPAIGKDGTIYVGSNDNKLYAINPNGIEKWNFTTDFGIESSPAIGPDGTIYVGSIDYKLYAINPDGTEKWNFATGGDILSSPAIGSDGTIYVGSNDNKLYVINSNGTEKWCLQVNGQVWSSPAIGSDGTIYVGCNFGNLYAIGKSTNQPPNTPSTPLGPTSGETNTSYSFSTSATDPEGDQIKYGWDWDGDGTVDEWSELVDSGNEVNQLHSWSFAGIYNMKVKAQDENGAESGWSDVLTVTITSEIIDTDGDGIPDSEDEDDDNDGYNDDIDRFPLDPNEWLDTDSDGIGNNADPDDDNDEYDDDDDYYPLDPTKWLPESKISISSITLSKYGPSAGEEVTIYVEIQNVGDNDCDALVEVYDGDPNDDGTQIGIDQTVTIPAEGTSTISVTWTAIAGDHAVCAVVEDLETREKVIAYLPLVVGENIPSILVLSTGDINIYRFEPGQERTISVEVTCYLQTVNNVHLVVLDDQNLTIDLTVTPLRTMTDGETTKFYLRIIAPELPEGVDKLERDIVIQAVGDNGIFSNAEELDIVISQSAVTFLNPITIAGAVATGSLATLGAAAVASRRNENWKYLLLSLFAVPLYTRIHGKKTLDNFVRGQVYGHIQSKPGTHFNEIRKTLKLGNGNLAYHLRKLEKEGFITSKRDKRNRRFYPVGVEVPEEDGIKLSKTQENILDFIERHPKSSQKEMTKEIKESQQTISYNINVLVREGFLKEEKINGTKRYEIFDENT